jgi:zinc protease
MQIIAEPNCEVVKLVAVFDVGRYCESQRGLASSVANMIKKATHKKSNTALQEYIDRYAINIEIHASALYFTAELHCHLRFVNEAVSVFFEILFEAKFTEELWTVVRNQTKESIIQQENQTDFWADKLISEYTIGENNPLGYYSQVEDYDTIRIDLMSDFYSNYIQSRMPELFLAGDVNGSTESLIEKELLKYSLHKNKIEFNPKIPSSIPKIIKKKIEGTSQSSIRLGKLIPRATFEDFIELELYNTMLGGYYTSELMQELRINNGFTYGAYSFLIHFPGFSFLQLGFETDSNAIKPSILAIKELFSRLKLEDKSELIEARKQYYSQWSKNAERSLQEIMYRIKLYKLGYSYEDYSQLVENYTTNLPFDFSKFKSEIYQFESYNQTIVS